MLSKCISILVLAVCVTGPMVSSANYNERRPFDLLNDVHYGICSWFVDFAKANRGPELWKPIVESACSLHKDAKFVEKCKRTSGKYLQDLANKPKNDFCQEVNLIDVETMGPSGGSKQGDYSVCKYLVSYANSIKAPASWKPKLFTVCSMIDPLYPIGYCEKTVYKYFNELVANSPDKFCSDLNLIDV